MLACSNKMLLRFYLFKFETPVIRSPPQGNVTVYQPEEQPVCSGRNPWLLAIKNKIKKPFITFQVEQFSLSYLK